VKEGLRRWCVHRADRHFLSAPRTTRLLVQSHTVRDRLRGAIGLEGEVLYPPPPVRPYRCDGYGTHFLFVSRLTPHKRLDLVLRALAEPAAAGIRLVVIGDGESRADLRRLAGTLGVLDRVAFLGSVDEDTLVAHYARCRAVCFTPLQEDYGFVTAEAFASGKAVITCRDSGGPAELVRDEETGYVSGPEPVRVAAALDALAASQAIAERMGQAALRAAQAHTWESTVERLVRW
jgi:glycosyltransferase involved in cell wall biosynthesis